MKKCRYINLSKILKKGLAIKNQYFKEFLAELLGTFILVVFCSASGAQIVFSGNPGNGFISIAVGFSIGITLGIMVALNISGGHINPAVTLNLAIWGKFPWRKVPIYIIAQYLGAFLGAVCVYGIYKNAFDAFEATKTLTTAGIFASYPGSIVDSTDTVVPSYLSAGNGFGNMVFGAMILLLGISFITDKKNTNIPKYLIAPLIGLTALGIALTFGLNGGFAINPARDLGPRIFTLIAGWGNAPFEATTDDGYTWFWIPPVAAFIGGFIGIAIYSIFIEFHETTEENERDSIKESNGLPKVAFSASS